METVQVKLNKSIVEDAAMYARQKGLDLSSMIEDYLLRVTRKKKTGTEDIPDIVLSLLGAGEIVEDDDLNARKAFYTYLEEKYQ